MTISQFLADDLQSQSQIFRPDQSRQNHQTKPCRLQPSIGWQIGGDDF